DARDLVHIEVEGATGCSHSSAPRAVNASRPAIIVYTSGSTGRPKGILISHQSISCYLAALADAIGFDREHRYLHSASFAFSSSNRQLLLPLVFGGTVVLADEADLSSPLALIGLLRSANITIMDLIPSRLRSYVRVLERMPSPERIALCESGLRLVLTASE